MGEREELKKQLAEWTVTWVEAENRLKNFLPEVKVEEHIKPRELEAWVLTEGRVPNVEAALAKAYGEVYMKRVAATITQILGHYGQLMPESKYVPLAGRVAHNYLFSPGYTLMAGSHEILKGVLATRGLGLPRE